MVLRSGNSTMFNNPSTASTLVTATASAAATVAPPFPSTVKFLHQCPTIKNIGSEDPRYSALSCLQQSEDFMTNNSIMSRADMMSFLMSQLIPGSLAFTMMSAHCFKPCMLQDDYAEFRSNFLRAFEASRTHDSFLWAFRYAELLTAQFGNVGHMVGQVHATE